jgi:hypothetical protein
MFGHGRFASRERQPVLYIQQENANSRVQRDLQSVLGARGLGDFRRTNNIGVQDWTEFDPDRLHAEQVAGGWEMPRFEVLSHAGIDLSDTCTDAG